MSATPIFGIAYRGNGELGQPVNEITEEMALSIEAALGAITGTGASITSLPAATGWTPAGGYTKLGKIIIAHFQWSKTGSDLVSAAASLGTLPVGARPISGFVRNILYNSSSGGTFTRLTVGTDGVMFTNTTTVTVGNSLTGSLVWIAA